jgi:hypothetical protein
MKVASRFGVAAAVVVSSWAAAGLPTLNVSAACTAGPPSIASLSPNVGPPGGGTAVVITGCSFTGATGVGFGSTAAAFAVNSDTQITATSPHEIPGVVDVNVKNSLGTSPSSPAGRFTFTDACQSATLTPDKPSSQQTGTLVTFNATASNCSNPEFLFYWSPPIGGWYVARGYGGPSWTWDSHGDAVGAYSFDVWARQRGSGDPWQAATVVSYQLTPGGAPCGNAGVTSDHTSNTGSGAMVGAIVTITATSTGCTDPEYLFWIQHCSCMSSPGTWTPIQGYGGPTFVWNTVGADGATDSCIQTPDCFNTKNGTYNFSVWVRQRGSGAPYQSFATITFQMVSWTACQGASITSDKTTPQQSGTIVTFTGAATPGYCLTTQYQWWVQPPGGGWMVAKPYNLSSTFAWNTGTLAVGTYQVVLWVRQNGSTATEEAYSITSYVLSAPAPCSNAGLSADKPSPQTEGTIITWTASSTGCSQPQYLFFVNGEDAIWRPVFGWNGPVFAWNTAGLPPGRDYNVDVWARQNGSSAEYETFKMTFYSYTLLSQVPTCAHPQLTPDKASPQKAGTTIVFTASSSGCPRPQYRFFVSEQATLGVWYPVQDWDGPTFTWHTSGLAPDTYQFDVWARQTGVDVPWESYKLIDYVLN